MHLCAKQPMSILDYPGWEDGTIGNAPGNKDLEEVGGEESREEQRGKRRSEEEREVKGHPSHYSHIGDIM